MIMDEPTSAVDIRTEASIIEAVEKLMHNRTTVMIAHRLSTLEKCDIVLVMREGRLNMITNDLEEAKLQLMKAEQSPERPGPAIGPMLVG